MSETNTVSPLRQRMIEDMAARKLNPNTQRSHIQSCKRFAAWLKRSPDTATPDEVRGFQLHLIESGASICNRNRIETNVDAVGSMKNVLHDVRASYQRQFRPNLAFVEQIGQSLEALEKRRQEGDVSASGAIEIFRSLSLPVADRFTQFNAVFEERLSAIERMLGRAEEPIAKARRVSALVRQRLDDPRPLDKNDLMLVERMGEAIGEFTGAISVIKQNGGEFSEFPALPKNLREQLDKIVAAGIAAVEAVKRSKWGPAKGKARRARS
jgi:Phage integrase, N-terminal SAM-like domain